MALATFGLFALVLCVPKRKRKALLIGGILALLLVIAMAGCGGSATLPAATKLGTPPGSYTITITATSGPTQHTMTVTLNVQ